MGSCRGEPRLHANDRFPQGLYRLTSRCSFGTFFFLPGNMGNASTVQTLGMEGSTALLHGRLLLQIHSVFPRMFVATTRVRSVSSHTGIKDHAHVQASF